MRAVAGVMAGMVSAAIPPVGPLGFAVLAESGGYPPAWYATAATGTAAAVAILFAARRRVTHPGRSRQLAGEVARDRP